MPSPSSEPESVSARGDLLDRTRPLACDPIDQDSAPGPFANGALAGVECLNPVDGVTELRLFEFPGTYRLRLYHRSRVEDAPGRVRATRDACLGGEPGVGKWEHGRIACWTIEGGTQAVLHWTDERTDSYGIIRADIGVERPLDQSWQILADLFEPTSEP